MSYFVTGGTGFIGRFLIGNLLKRKGSIHVLVRKASMKKFDAMVKKQGWDPKRVIAVPGDMTAANCGLTAAQVRALTAKIQHFFHLAAIYDLTASAAEQQAANIDGTRHALELHQRLQGLLEQRIGAVGLVQGRVRQQARNRVLQRLAEQRMVVGDEDGGHGV